MVAIRQIVLPLEKVALFLLYLTLMVLFAIQALEVVETYASKKTLFTSTQEIFDYLKLPVVTLCPGKKG